MNYKKTKNHFQKNKINYLILILISILYLIKLTYFPIFADEAIYINWADRVFNSFEGPFISLNDGKPPLFIWMIGFWSRIFTNNLFFSGRFASVFLFILFLFFINFIFSKYYDKKQALISIILLSLSPYIFFHTRMALIDSSLSVLLLSALIFYLTPKIKYHYILSGILFGLAYWTKTPAMFLIPFPLISWILFDRKIKNLFKPIISILISVIICYGMKVSIFFPKLFARSQDFTFSFDQILSGETSHIWSNINDLFSWIIAYNFYPYLISIILSLYFAIKNKNKFILNLFFASLIFSSPFILLGKVVSSRYYLPSIFLFSFISAYFFTCLKNKKLKITLLFLTLIYPIYANFTLFTNYNNFNFPERDEFQYLKEWSSGIGLKQSMDYFAAQAQTQNIKVLTEGFFGTTPDGAFVYYASLPQSIKNNFTLVGVGYPSTKEFQNELSSDYDKLYYIGNSHRINPIDIDKQNLDLIKEFAKKDDYSSFQIYEINYEN